MKKKLFIGLAVAIASPAAAQTVPSPAATAVAFREEQLARTIGAMAYIYGFPAVDSMRMMNEWTDPKLRYSAPVDHFFRFGDLAVPGQTVNQDGQAKTPNNDTLYFLGYMDLRSGPRVVSVPEMDDRYYVLTMADFYSEVQHVGRRTTGTGAQQFLVVGPGWAGRAPGGMTVIRIRTNQVLMLGRMLARAGSDVKAANKLIDEVKIRPLDPSAGPAAPLALPSKDDLTKLDFFRYLNEFLRTNPRLPGEEALMAQFDQVGIGPSVRFDPDALSPATRRGLEAAIADANRIVVEGRLNGTTGWSSAKLRLGEYGYDYLLRASVEFSGLHANLPAESVYLRNRTDRSGAPLSGGKKYRFVLPAGEEPPVDAFWSLTAYDLKTFDLIENPARIYSLGDRTTDLKRQSDGSLVFAVQKDMPNDPSLNWLPVADGPFFLILRLYQPKPEVLSGTYLIPDIEEVP